MSNDDEEVVKHLRALEAQGFEVKDLWREHARRIAAYELGTPGELDARYSVPVEAPPLTEHFVDGEPRELVAHALWVGYHYTLTPGQRRWFREFAGMTPAGTATVTALDTWPGTQHPRSFRVRVDKHVDPRLRGRTVTEARVTNVPAFFIKCAEFDAEEAKVKTLSLVEGPVKVWRAVHRWAVEDLCGVKLHGGVGIADLTESSITFTDESGRMAKVDRKEWLGTVADYQRLYEKGQRTRPVPDVKADPLYKSLAQLFAGLEDEAKGNQEK